MTGKHPGSDLQMRWRKSLPKLIIGYIETLIQEGHLQPGDPLPAEGDLAETLDVGRSSVREAVRVLDELGVVQVRQGKRTVLTESGREILDLPLKLLIMVDNIPYREVSEARVALETSCAGLAAERACCADIQKLQKLTADPGELLGNHKTAAEAGTAFHLAVAEAAQNRVMLRMLAAIRSRLSETPWLPEELKTSLEQHRTVVCRIADADPEGAEEAMRQHLQRVERLAEDDHE